MPRKLDRNPQESNTETASRIYGAMKLRINKVIFLVFFMSLSVLHPQIAFAGDDDPRDYLVISIINNSKASTYNARIVNYLGRLYIDLSSKTLSPHAISEAILSQGWNGSAATVFIDNIKDNNKNIEIDVKYEYCMFCLDRKIAATAVRGSKHTTISTIRGSLVTTGKIYISINE